MDLGSKSTSPTELGQVSCLWASPQLPSGTVSLVPQDCCEARVIRPLGAQSRCQGVLVPSVGSCVRWRDLKRWDGRGPSARRGPAPAGRSCDTPASLPPSPRPTFCPTAQHWVSNPQASLCLSPQRPWAHWEYKASGASPAPAPTLSGWSEGSEQALLRGHQGEGLQAGGGRGGSWER